MQSGLSSDNLLLLVAALLALSLVLHVINLAGRLTLTFLHDYRDQILQIVRIGREITAMLRGIRTTVTSEKKHSNPGGEGRSKPRPVANPRVDNVPGADDVSS